MLTLRRQLFVIAGGAFLFGFCVSSLRGEDAATRSVEAFLSAAQIAADGAIRQNQFKLDIANGKIDAMELWIVPSQNLLFVKGGILQADKIESLQKGIDLSSISLSAKLAVSDGRIFLAQPMRGGWSEIKEAKPFLGHGSDLQLDLASFADYFLKVEYWKELLKNSHQGSPSYAQAEKNLALLVPRDGIIEYADASTGLRIRVDKNSIIKRAQTLQDGIVFYEVQNELLNTIPAEILSVIDEIKNRAEDPTGLLAGLKGKRSLGLFLVQTPEGFQKIMWLASMGPAALAGLKEGDVVTKINGKDIKSLDRNGVKAILASESNFTFSIVRDGKEFESPAFRKEIFNP